MTDLIWRYGLPSSVVLVLAAAFALCLPWLVPKALGARRARMPVHPVLADGLTVQCQRAGVAPPRVYLLNSDSPNLMLVGGLWGRSAMVVTTGVLRLLPDAQLSALLASQLARMGPLSCLMTSLWVGLTGILLLPAHLLDALSLLVSDAQAELTEKTIVWQLLWIVLGLPAIVWLVLFPWFWWVWRADVVAVDLDPQVNCAFDLAQALETVDRYAGSIPLEQAFRFPEFAAFFTVTPFREIAWLRPFSVQAATPGRVRRLLDLARQKESNAPKQD